VAGTIFMDNTNVSVLGANKSNFELPQLASVGLVFNDPACVSRIQLCLKSLMPNAVLQQHDVMLDCKSRLLITDLDPSLNEIQTLYSRNILTLVITDQSLWGLDIPGVRYLLSPYNALELKTRITEIFKAADC